MVVMDEEVTQALGGLAPLFLFLFLLVLQLALRFLPSLPGVNKKRMSSQQAELVRQIKQLNREADALNTPATFAKSSKLRRAAAAKEKDLALLKPSSGGDYSWLVKRISPPLVVQGVVILALGGWFRQTYVASVPAFLLQPFGGMLALRGGDPDIVNVSVLPWLLLSSHVASHLVNSIWHQR